MRFLLILLSLAALLLPALGQEQPPLPRPRPERDASGEIIPGPPPTADGQEDGMAVPGDSAADALARFTGGPPQQLSLSAKITEDGAVVPGGVTWRIYDTKANDAGGLKLVAKSDDARAAFSLSPGRYVIHVAYGHTQTSDTVTITNKPEDKVMVLEAGGLKLNGAITGDVAIPPALLSFDIYPSEADSDGGEPLVSNVRAGQMVRLNAGVYHIVSHFGRINAVVRADLRVEPGQLTDATLYHHAAQISFRLVSEQGGEAIADVEWTVKTASGDTVYSELGAFPSCVLSEGEYTVLAKRGGSVYNRDFSVSPGAAREIEVLTSVY